MDLYEALTDGWTKEELIEKFYTELGAAEIRLKEGSVCAKSEAYDLARCNLIHAFIDYIEELFNIQFFTDDVYDLEAILHVYLTDFEDLVMQKAPLHKVENYLDTNDTFFDVLTNLYNKTKDL